MKELVKKVYNQYRPMMNFSLQIFWPLCDNRCVRRNLVLLLAKPRQASVRLGESSADSSLVERDSGLTRERSKDLKLAHCAQFQCRLNLTVNPARVK